MHRESLFQDTFPSNCPLCFQPGCLAVSHEILYPSSYESQKCFAPLASDQTIDLFSFIQCRGWLETVPTVSPHTHFYFFCTWKRHCLSYGAVIFCDISRCSSPSQHRVHDVIQVISRTSLYGLCTLDRSQVTYLYDKP